MKEHDAAWDELWDSADIVVPGDEELQLAFRGSLYHILANIRGGSEGVGIGDNSISVGGLASDSYAGCKRPQMQPIHEQTYTNEVIYSCFLGC